MQVKAVPFRFTAAGAAAVAVVWGGPGVRACWMRDRVLLTVGSLKALVEAVYRRAQQLQPSK